MGMIKCPDCGKEISDMAQSCPNCGRPMNVTFSNRTTQNVSEMGAMVSRQAQNQIVKKNSHGCLIAFLTVVGLVVFTVVMCTVVLNKIKEAAGDLASVTNTESSTVLNKDEAGKLDEDIWSKTVNVIKVNNDIMQAMDLYADGQLSELDFYNTCKESYDYCQKVTFPSSEDEGASAYIDSCKTFALYVQTEANALIKYIDSKKTEDLSKVKEQIDGVQQALQIVAGNRGVFLSLAGFSEDEIKEIIDKADEQIGE